MTPCDLSQTCPLDVWQDLRAANQSAASLEKGICAFAASCTVKQKVLPLHPGNRAEKVRVHRA